MTTTMEYTKKYIKDFLRRELKEYEAWIGDMTDEERKGLRKWVADGCSPYENPCLFCDDDGHAMDYIEAIRIADDMSNHPEDYFREYEAVYGDFAGGAQF